MATEDWKLQVSYKVGNDMINIRANTGDELSVLLESIGDYAPQIVATRSALNNAEVVAPLSTGATTENTAPSQPSQVGWNPPQSVTPPPQNGLGPTCAHGPRVHRVGIAKATGRPYDFWACPTPRGTVGQCAPANG